MLVNGRTSRRIFAHGRNLVIQGKKQSPQESASGGASAGHNLSREGRQRGFWGPLDNGEPPVTAFDGNGGSTTTGKGATTAAGGSSSVGAAETILLWKSCTKDNPFYDEASPMVDDVARENGWQVLDVRQVDSRNIGVRGLRGGLSGEVFNIRM